MNICWVKGSFTMIELMEPSHIKKGTNLWKRLSRWRWYNGIGSTWQCRRCKKHGFNPWVRKIPWRRAWQPTPVCLPGKSHDKGTWQAIVHGVTESNTTEHSAQLTAKSMKEPRLHSRRKACLKSVHSPMPSPLPDLSFTSSVWGRQRCRSECKDDDKTPGELEWILQK